MRNYLSRQHLEHGFTLLELLVVSTLISIMLAVSIPRVQGLFFNDPLKRSARLLVSAINEARRLSLGSEFGGVMLVDVGAGAVEIRSQQGTENRKDGSSFKPLRIALDESVSIASVWSLSSGRRLNGAVPVWINRRGMTEPVIIELRDADRVMTLKGSPFLTEVEIFDRALSPSDRLIAGTTPSK